MDSNNVGVNFHVNGVRDFRVTPFEKFVTVDLTAEGSGVTVFIRRPEHARAIAELFTAAAVALDEKRLAAPAKVK